VGDGLTRIVPGEDRVVAGGPDGIVPGKNRIADDPDRIVPDDHRRTLEADARLQHARDLAWGALNQRDRTVAELARRLAKKRIEPAVIEIVVGELCEQGYLDDARFARRFAEDRRRLDDWGAERIERRLRALGVDDELIAAAVAERDPAGELEAALGLLRRRFPDPPAGPRDCERALGVLLRKGYEPELAHDAVRHHAEASLPAGE
jgi:regulatory protein